MATAIAEAGSHYMLWARRPSSLDALRVPLGCQLAGERGEAIGGASQRAGCTGPSPYRVCPRIWGMRWVSISGNALYQWRNPTRCGRAPRASAISKSSQYYLEQLTTAIDFAHDRGIIHRDIKPANILVTPEGQLLLGDFGLVKIITGEPSSLVRLTATGALVGTPEYMAPEQVAGKEVDLRADVYSLGILLFQMVTGKTPFCGETPIQIAVQHLELPSPSPRMGRPDLSIEAEKAIKRALAKKPSDRYRRAGDLANAFGTATLNGGDMLI
jgi:serine/threonine protein kinase